MIPTVTLGWLDGALEVPAADQYLRSAIESSGEYSGAEYDLYQALLRPGDVALDVGSNIGVFAIGMARAVGRTGRVLAFEPQPLIFDILSRNLALNRIANVEAHRAMVAEADGTGEFVDLQSLPDDLLFNFGAMGVHSRVRNRFGAMVPTPVRSVDGFALDRCAFIKVDAEGAEERVLAGAAETVERCRPILSLECDRPDGKSPWVDGLLAADYRLWRFRGSNLREPNPRGRPIADLPNPSILMVLAVPSERAGVLDDLDTARLQPLPDRETLERLSKQILRAAT